MMDWLYRRFATRLGHEIVQSLREDEWVSDGGYYLVRADRRVRLWIANGAGSLRLYYTGKPVPFPMSSEFRPCWADRMLIWREVRRMRIPSPRMHQYSKAERAVLERGMR